MFVPLVGPFSFHQLLFVTFDISIKLYFIKTSTEHQLYLFDTTSAPKPVSYSYFDIPTMFLY